MNRPTTAVATLLACALVSASVHGRRALAAPPAPVWSEVPWPFPMDQWGKGKAFTCKAADCGTQVTLYIRAKIG